MDHNPADVAPRVFVATPVCAGKEYYWLGVLDALLAQEYPAKRLHFHCVFDGEPRMARLMWEAFRREAEAAGATASSQTVRIAERHRDRFVNVATLREAARLRLLDRDEAWLWWVECDCPPPPEALGELLALGVPLATALVADRSNARHLNHQEREGVPGEAGGFRRGDGPRTIRTSGLSCCLMARGLLEGVGWPDGWREDPRATGGEDHYLQARLREEHGARMTLHPGILVPHVDAHPREPAVVVRHEPHWNGDGLAVRRVECDWRECPGAWRPRRRPWEFIRRWRNFRPPDEVPEEFRELVLRDYPQCMTHDGPDLPAGIDEAEHELLLPGEACRIGGLYAAMNEAGEQTHEPTLFAAGDRAWPGHAAHDLVEIEEV